MIPENVDSKSTFPFTRTFAECETMTMIAYKIMRKCGMFVIRRVILTVAVWAVHVFQLSCSSCV